LVKNHKNYPIIVSLQGILSEYQHHYYAGIEYSEMLKRISIKSLLFRDGFFSGRWDFIRNSKLEQKILKESKCVEGRSTWDYVSSKNINPSLDYYYCPRMIRSPFFEYQWNSETMEPHTIFVHQGNYPIKGLHFVFIALKKLLDKYPDTKLYIAGSGYFYPKTLKEKLVQNPYIKYLKDLMNKLGIENNIIFTGFLSAEELASKLSKVNVVVIPSSIENAPNSLAESEIVGTPTIASFVGGNMDMLEHNKEGYLYCYNEPNMLAEYIERIFDSNELANSFSFNEKKTARGRHNPEKLEKTLLAIYEDVINKFN
jgi:glycosyltransferase involved in cell wall biosynthesis